MTNIIMQLFTNPVLRRVPQSDIFHEMLETAGKFLKRDVTILTARNKLSELKVSDEEMEGLTRLSDMGHICILPDANLVALNTNTARDNDTITALSELFMKKKSNMPKSQFCRGIILSRIMDLGYGMVQQYSAATKARATLAAQQDEEVQVARFTKNGLQVTTTTMGKRLVDSDSPWYHQLFTTKDEQMDFMEWSDFIKSIRDYDDDGNRIDNENKPGFNIGYTPKHYVSRNGVIHTINNLYEIELVKVETVVVKEPKAEAMVMMA